MRIMEKTIAVLLVICMMFSFLPVDMMSGVLEDVFADVPSDSNYTVTSKTPGEYTPGGPLSRGQPGIRVVLSRDPDTYLNGTEEALNAMYNAFSYKYPISATDNSNFMENSLFILDDNKDGGVYRKWSGYWATHGGAYVKDSTISFYSLNPTVGILNYTGEDVRNLVFARRVVNACPENKFKTTVVGLYDAKQIVGTDALADNVWKLYIPKDADGYDEEYAYNVVSYVFNYTTSFQKRVTDFVDDKFNIYDVDAKELTNKDKFEIATGYVGLLSSLYVVAEAQGADRVAASYEKAINDYLSNNNIKAQPVTLLVDTCQVYREAGTATQSIMPSIDVLELSLASQASYSVLEGDGAFLETLNKQGSRVTTAKTGISGFTMRQQLHEIAAASLEAYPYNTTKGYATGSNDVTQKKILRLADMPTSRTKWYTNSQHNHPLGYCLPVVSLSSKSAGSGGQGAIWTRDNNKVHWVTWDWDRNDGHFLDIFHTGEDGFLDGWAIVGSHFSDPTPTASFFVVDTIQGTPDTCEEYVQIITPSKLTITIGQGSDFLSYLDTLPEDSKISLEASISRKEYKDSLKSTPVEVIEHLTDLEDDLFLDQVSVEVFKSKVANTISLEDSYFVDSNGAPKTYQRLKNNPMLVLFEYEVNLTLTIDKTVYEFKSDDIVARVGDTPQNSSSFQVKAYKADADAAPDIEIVAPTDRTKPDYNHNPSANENLAELTQVIRWYEYTSVMGSMSGNVDASFGSTMGYDDTSVDADIGAFAEIKSNTPGDEKYEVLGGIPSTEELYFSVGGSEWKVSMILQYWMNEHSRDRTYTIQFDGTTCEFNNNKKGEGDIWEGIDLPRADGASQTTMRFEHTGTTVTATWTGTIPNDAVDSINITAPATNHSAHSTEKSGEIVAVPNHTEYLAAVKQANNWMAAMANLSSTFKWKAASDEKERSVTIDKMDLGTGGSSTSPGTSGGSSDTCSDGTWLSGSASAEFSNPETTKLTVKNSSTCNYKAAKYDSEGNLVSAEVPCTATSDAKTETLLKGAATSYTITVTYTIEPHAICGPCCGHELPALWDTWKQGMVFDYMKISQIRLFLLDQGSVEGMTELTGTDRITASVVSGNPTYFMNIATMTEQYENPYMVAGGLKEITGPKAQGNTWYTGTLYEPNNPYGYKPLGTYNNREAQSSRAGRLRYLLDPVWAATAKTSFDYKYGPGGTTDAVGGNKSGTITIDYSKVANTKQHDDVIYKVGTRTPNCDGMATSGNFGKDDSVNVDKTMTTGHVNKWADGMLYTNILNTEDYSGYWNDSNVASIASTYEPKKMRDNDPNLVKYREDYGHHLAEDGLVKTDYGHHADIVDTRTAEWQVFNAARTTKIIGIVISDFLIMQTSGGDQSVFYFEKASVPTEAQEHFQKVSIPEAEMTTDNPLSIFNAAAVCEDSTIKDGVANFEIVGGYNGRYDDPANKYRPYSLVTQEYLDLGGYDGNNWNVYNASYKTTDYQTRAGEASDYNMYGNTKIVTIFDDDPAGSFNRPKRQAETTGLKIYQDNIQILPTTPNRYYQPTDASIWYFQVVGTYSAGGHFMNKQSGGYGVWTAGNVNLGWPYRERYGDAWFDYWGSSIGLQLNTKYYLTKDGDSNTSSVNGVVVYTPVSAEDALVLPQGDLTVNNITVSRDQRVESFTFPNMNDVVNALKVCTLDPATCEYRILDCKYLHDTVVAEFDFTDYTRSDGRYYVKNNITGVEYLLPEGFSIVSGSSFGGYGTYKGSDGAYLNATGTNAWSIPFADLGIANDKTNRVKVSMDLKVNATSGNTMVVGFRNLGFVINSNGSGKFLVPYDEDPTIVGTSKSFTNNMKSVHLDIIFGFNNIVDCTAYVNGQEATINEIIDYRNKWTEFTENGKTVRKLVKTHVALAGENLKLSPPDNFTTADIMASINIGTWSNTNSTYTANFYLDNLNIILMGGTTEHTSACYVTSTTHAVSKVHVCNEDCWLKEDLYTCDGLPNANYQLGCGKEEGIPKVTVNTSVDFEYKGYGQVVTLTPGTYKLEVWGAQGGGTYGGKGGYSYGNLVVTQTTDFYVYVGSRGSDYDSSVSGYQTASGGFNGGGDGYGDQGAAGGGGATDIRRAGTALSNRIIVAGGGGGQAVDSSTYYGGVGGGSNGTAGYSGGTYGTQSSGYALGEGGDGSSTCSSPDNGGGGGGYYGGYGGSDDEGAGGGGSGYIGGVTSGGTTIAGNASMTQPDGTTATGHSGNGYARITVVSGGGTITTDDFSSLEYGVPTTYTYSGDYEEITLEPGLYVVELYGAQGGASTTSSSAAQGSKGTYVKGELTVTETTTAYLYIGGKGNIGNNTAGGWNGGGKAGGCSCGSGSGGGATDIRIGGTALSNRVMVAGGGGGAGYGSYAGRTTAKSCGTLGIGDYGHTSNDGGGGGGGYHGGYTGQEIDMGGYIGTSYVNGTEYTSDVNSGNTIVTHNSNSGNGYIVITPKGHVHSGTAGLDYANGCYTVPTVHKHDINTVHKELICGLDEGGDGQVRTYSTVGETSVTLPAGRYKLEVWGAEGGGACANGTTNSNAGGLGGYSVGEIILNTATTVYVNVGGKGSGPSNSTSYAGGYNGGGAVGSDDSDYDDGGGSGGGATHIGLKSGLLSTFSSDYSSKLIIVAGGGGGGGFYNAHSSFYRAGAGGGASGGTCTNSGAAGTQTSGYAFGQGEAGGLYSGGGVRGGGGGGFYGGYASTSGYYGAAGGSGYINTSKLTNAQTIIGTSSFPNTAGTGNETGHAGNGYAKITNLDHQHTDACYKSTPVKVTCDKIPAGTYRCTGEPNATTDFNIHEHTIDCFYNYYNLTPRTYNYVGDVITYKVPYTDDYRIEAYGASSGTRSGYTSAVVRLKRGDVLYFYIGGRDGFNEGHTDVRVLTSFYNYNQIMGFEDEIERREWLLDYQRSLDSRILNSATVYNGSFVSDFGTYTLSQTSILEVGNSSDGRVIVTPLNKLPVTETPDDNYILEQILNGDIPEEEVYKYLGEELADIIINTAQPFATFENFSWTNHQGVTPVSNSLSFDNGNIVNLIENGGAYEFSIPVNIAPKTLRKIVVTLDNNTASTDFGVAINQVGSANRVLASMKANTKNQEISINVRNLCWDKTVTKLIFNTSANNNTGTTVIKKIELYGHADWTEMKPNSTYAYSNIARMNGFSSTNTNGFTSLANCNLTYSGGNMIVTPTGSNSRTTWNSVEKIEANALKAIKLVFTNKSGSATTGEMYYKNNTSESWSETRGYQWYVGSGTAAQTVWIDLVNKITYNETTNTFRRIGGTQTAWANDIVAMRFDWTNLTTGSIEVSEITFIGKGSTSIKHTFNYLEKAQPIKLTSGKWNLDLYGAQGGDGRIENKTDTVQSGGLGGRTTGVITANGSTLYYVYVGGKGGAAPSTANSFGLGGWNGGGAGGAELNGEGTPENGAGGGGMTHITTSGTDGESVTNSTTQKTVTVAPLTTPEVVKTATSGSGSISLTPGIYRLEATGAQGTAGEGGLASGWLKVTSTGTYYYSVGGQGAYTWINSSNSATNALVKAGSGAMKGVDAVVGGYTTHTHTADCGSITYTISSDDDSGAHHCAELYVSAGSYYIRCSYGNRDTYLSMTTPPSNATLKTSAGWVYNDCGCGGSDEDNCDYDGYIVAWTPATNYTCNNLPLNDGYITPVAGQAAQAEQTSSTYNVETAKTFATVSDSASITITRYVDLSGYSNLSNLSYTIVDDKSVVESEVSLTYGYTGKVVEVPLNPGTYKLEVWGAQGGGSGGKGGYSVGTYDLSTATSLFVVVGSTGGYNGGGSGNNYGGGATHIATSTGLLSALSSNKDSVLIVAGGGGGKSGYGGYGGGAVAGSGSGYGGDGATQSSGGAGWEGDDYDYWGGDGSFGKGGSGTTSFSGDYSGGGGGGYYGGGGSGASYAYEGDDGLTYYYPTGGGGGGSGFVSSKLTGASTIAGNTSFPSTSGGTETGHTGNGYAKITGTQVEVTGNISVSNVTFKVTVNETSKSMTFDTSKVIAVAGGGGGGTGYTNASHTAASETWGGNGGGSSGTSTNTTYTTPGTQNSGYDVRGVGGNGYSYLGGANYAATGGGGAGWYGGYTSKALTQTTPIGGAGGSGYASSAVEGPTLTAGVRSGNGVAILTSNSLTGIVLLNAGPDSVTDVTITAGTYGGTPFKATYVNPLENDTARQTIHDYITENPTNGIPDIVDGDYNPIFVCKFQEKNKHECSILDEDGEIRNLCVTTVRLDCTEPHHKGTRVDENGDPVLDKYGNPICKEHYSGSNRICWSACGNDDNHKLTKTEVDVDEEGTTVLQLAEYLQIDEGFTVYFPNRGNFYGNGLLGLSAPQTTRGYGYTNNMDTTRWTREKRVMFPFPVIYENLTYPAYTWIELEVADVYFNFYLPVSTAEMANARVVFEVEAINCGTKQGTNPLYDIEYSSVVDEAYTNALTTFISKYLQNYQEDVKATGYKLIRSQYEEDNAGVGHRIAYSNVGILQFLETKQDRVDGEVAELVKALEKIDRQVEQDFEGDRGDYINPNATADNGINNALKPLTFNDNRYRFDNTLRSDSYQSLHGGYKKFYLDVIGRIGNFAITDTEDFRFSNFFKVSIDNLPEGTTFDATDPNNWLVDGLVKQVDENIQNYYVGDLYDIRGNKASVNTRWLDTYGTQGWMAGTYENGDRNINKKNLVSQILTGDVNTIDVLKNEELRFGYDIFTSIVTMGSYQEGQVQIIPKYYALKVTDKDLDGVPTEFNVDKGDYVPLDVYVNKDGAYEPVNIFGNAANGNSNKGNVQLSDYVFNLDWTNEAGRRNFSLDEQARTNRVKEYYRTFIYDMSAYEDPSVLGDDMASDMNIEDLSIIDVIEYVTPQGETNYLGTPQYILLDGRHRTFIGDSKSYDNNPGGEAKWVGPDETTNFGLDKGIYTNAYNPTAGSPLEQIEFERSVQRWHSKIGLPSSAVFVPHGQAVNATTLDYVMGENEDEWVIVCTAEIIAVGAIWNINYSQPWFSDLTIGDATFKTHKHTSGCTCNKVAHYPGHKVTDPNTGATVTCPWCIDPIIAVFGKTSVEDVEISQIY